MQRGRRGYDGTVRGSRRRDSSPDTDIIADADFIVNNVIIHGVSALTGGSLRAGHRAN